eukprot:TRINITY_DN14052_c0_g1_i1.p1 TRINITY_DN14052_c0_g1~~TRINITY_DN14052_c0_g1_i1.p1  ORF type:complete len:167 (-),score=33.28 TRINITY_DN14052_c0_g1_i1:140-640(-)
MKSPHTQFTTRHTKGTQLRLGIGTIIWCILRSLEDFEMDSVKKFFNKKKAEEEDVPSLSEFVDRLENGDFEFVSTKFHPSLIDEKDKHGRNLLWWAVYSGTDSDTRFVSFLLQHFDPNVSNDQKQTPLHIAYRHGKGEYVKLLLEHPKIDVSLKDEEGKTAGEYSS